MYLNICIQMYEFMYICVFIGNNDMGDSVPNNMYGLGRGRGSSSSSRHMDELMSGNNVLKIFKQFLFVFFLLIFFINLHQFIYAI